jgi:hypothetical protein
MSRSVWTAIWLSAVVYFVVILISGVTRGAVK